MAFRRSRACLREHPEKPACRGAAPRATTVWGMLRLSAAGKYDAGFPPGGRRGRVELPTLIPLLVQHVGLKITR